VPPDRWPDRDDSAWEEIDRQWQEPYGDRRQELVLIGRNLDREALTAMLDSALVTNAEMRLGQKGWDRFRDPFSEWKTTEELAAETPEHAGHAH
jgi:hypothetical protein